MTIYRQTSQLFGLLVLCLMVDSTTSAQGLFQPSWGNRLFPSRSIDFGSVARGSVLTHSFPVINETGASLQLTGVRASCGCTSGRMTTTMIPPGGRGIVEAVMDTTNFSGHKATKLYVSLQDGRGRRTEVGLDVSADIRTDLVLRPGSLDFGSIPAGRSAQRTIQIVHSGRTDWRIVRVVAANPAIQAKLNPLPIQGDLVPYQLVVDVNDQAQAGWLQDQIRLVTNDPVTPVVPVRVNGYVQPGVSVSPSPLMLKSSGDQQWVRGRAIVRGEQPFTITGVQADDPNLEVRCQTADQPRPAHVILVQYQNGSPDSTSATTTLKIQTDLPGQPLAVVPVSLRPTERVRR